MNDLDKNTTKIFPDLDICKIFPFKQNENRMEICIDHETYEKHCTCDLPMNIQ